MHIFVISLKFELSPNIKKLFTYILACIFFVTIKCLIFINFKLNLNFIIFFYKITL